MEAGLLTPNLSSPERSVGTAKSVNVRNEPKSDKRLASDVDARSTAVSTQRPPDRMRNNAVLSPQAATSQGARSQGTGGKQTGNRPMSGSSNEGRSVAAPSAEDPISAKAVKAMNQKKNATITEEEEYDDEDGDSQQQIQYQPKSDHQKSQPTLQPQQ